MVKSNDQSDPSLLSRSIQDLLSQAERVKPNVELLKESVMSTLNDGYIDDSKFTIEKIVQFAASLPNDSKLRDDLSNKFIETLWDGLQHPPISYLGDEFKYRKADGSNNNVMYPHLGAAGSHYARSVNPVRPKPTVLPDPGLIFDTLLRREGKGRAHPSGISSTLFYLATIIIHDLFHTNRVDNTKLDSSSYLDLGPLYGHNEEQQKTVRTFKDGLLKKDTFAESRLLGQPPGAAALIIAFNRFHNYVVTEMAIINEGDRFSLPPGITEEDPDYKTAQLKRDNDLFQTGRLVTCGLYVNAILNDYLRAILNLNQNEVDSDWSLDPRLNFNNIFDPSGVPKGIGNQVSVEFNFVYRWHAATSEHDEQWMKSFFAEVFGADVDPNTLSVNDFFAGVGKWTASQPPDPAQWPIGTLQRQEDGGFKDSDLVGLLTTATENVAGAFGARNIPGIMKAIEILGIQQGRQWNVATLNELRSFFKLKPHATFLEVNSDPAVAETLESLYGNVDDIELYVGMQAEEAKIPYYPGSGLCPGFTIATAVLADAVALVRGDRFYTTDYSPVNLTNFGFEAASSSFEVAKGGVMYKLLGRAFPGWYRDRSVYSLFPLTTPDKNHEILTKQGVVDKYDFSEPRFIGPPIPVVSWKGVTDTLKRQDEFHVPWGPHTFELTKHDYMLSGDKPANTKQRNFVKECMYKPENALKEVQRFYENITTELIHKHSHKLGDSYHLDVVKDIGNIAHANFVAHFFHIPLQSANGGANAYTEQELYDTLATLFAYVFLDLDSVKSFKLKEVSAASTKRLGEVMKASVSSARAERFASIKDLMGLRGEEFLSDYGAKLIDRLSQGGKSVDEVVWTIIPTAAAAVATQAQGWAQMIDLYLSDKYSSHWPAIQKLAQQTNNSPEAFEQLKKYALEGLRLATPAFGVLRAVVTADDHETTIHDGSNRTIRVKRGDAIFADFVSAGMDPDVFPDPEEVRLDRPEEVYIHHGWGAHACLGRPIVTTAAASMLGVFARLLGNLRRVPGAAGEMKARVVGGGFKEYLAADGKEWVPFPVSKIVVYDGFMGEED